MEYFDFEVGISPHGEKLHLLDCNTQGSFCGRIKWLESLEFPGVIKDTDDRFCKLCKKVADEKPMYLEQI